METSGGDCKGQQPPVEKKMNYNAKHDPDCINMLKKKKKEKTLVNSTKIII